MRGITGRDALSVALVAVVALGCGPKNNGMSEEFQKKLAEWSAGSAVDEGVARQTGADAAAQDTEYLDPGEAIWIQSGKSRIIRLARPVRRVSIADPELAGIVVLGPTTLMINAKKVAKEKTDTTRAGRTTIGTSASITGDTLTKPPRYDETTLVLWDGSGSTTAHTIFVADFIPEQVMLEVTIAELNRTAFEEHGIDFQSLNSSFSSNLFMGGGSPPILNQNIGIVPDLYPKPEGLRDILPLLVAPGKPNFAFAIPDSDVTAFVQALQTEGLATVLAQPKIMALSGQRALFQVGGEIPIEIVTSFTSDIEFKPFGTLVAFIPQVTEEGDIFLTVTPEVSQPDFNTRIGDVPTFRTRRASTSAHLRNGETFVLGGLLQTNRTETVRGLPYLQDIPVVGHFFRHTTYNDEITELMVIVTPHLVHPITDGRRVTLPTDREPLTNEEVRTKPHPAKATRPRIPGLGTGLTVPGLP